MANIIDAFLVTLGLDAKGFSDGQKKVEEGQKKLVDNSDRTSKQMDDHSKKVAEGIVGIRNQVVGLFAAFTAGRGLKDFIEDLTKSDSALGRTANNIGISVGQLSAWQGVAERAGGSAAGITGSLQGLSQQFQQLSLTGQSAVVPYFRAIGVAMADSTGKMRPMNDILLDLSDKLKGMDPAKAQAIGKGLGLDEGTVNVLMQGRDAIAALLAEQERLGHANDEDAAQAAKRLSAFKGLGQAADDLGRKLLTSLTPAILAVTDALTDFTEWAKEHPKTVEAAFIAITAVVTALSAAITIGLVGPAVIAGIGSLTAAISILSGAFATMGALMFANPIGIIVLAATAAGVAAYELYKHWDAVKALFVSVGDKASAMWDALTGKKHNGTIAPKVIAPAPPAPARPAASSPAAASPVAAQPNQPRGIRNFNPGNLNFANQSGATLEAGPGGRFAVFRTMEEGIKALAQQLQRYGSRGVDTIRSIISKFAPPNENNTKAYIDSVVKKLGVGAEEHLNLKDPAVLKALISAITTVEVGAGKIKESQISAGLALDPSLTVGAGTSAAGGATTNNSSNASNTSHQTTIGTVTVNTRATDANGIARSIGPAISQYSYVAQANTGLAG
jgi:hypothetical protein